MSYLLLELNSHYQGVMVKFESPAEKRLQERDAEAMLPIEVARPVGATWPVLRRNLQPKSARVSDTLLSHRVGGIQRAAPVILAAQCRTTVS